MNQEVETKLFNSLMSLDPTTDEFKHVFTMWSTLRDSNVTRDTQKKSIELKTLELQLKELESHKNKPVPWWRSKEMLALFGQLTTVALIMNYEKTNVLTTKAFGIVPKHI